MKRCHAQSERSTVGVPGATEEALAAIIADSAQAVSAASAGTSHCPSGDSPRNTGSRSLVEAGEAEGRALCPAPRQPRPGPSARAAQSHLGEPSGVTAAGPGGRFQGTVP